MQNALLERETSRYVKDSQEYYSDNQELKGKIEFLQKKIALSEQLRHIDIDELKMLSRSNLAVNETTAQLITKWEHIHSS